MLSSFPTNALGSGITYARLKVQAFMCKGERDGSWKVFVGFFWRINENIKICINISKNCTMHAADSLRVLSKPSTSQLDNDILWLFFSTIWDLSKLQNFTPHWCNPTSEARWFSMVKPNVKTHSRQVRACAQPKPPVLNQTKVNPRYLTFESVQEISFFP